MTDDAPLWPVVQQAKPTVVRPLKASASKSDHHTVLVLPDTQIGFWRLGTGEMIPMHDEHAMNVALQIARTVRPGRVVLLGDFLDLAEMSVRWATTPEMAFTTQATLDAGHLFLAQLKAICPWIDLIEGNHDLRIQSLLEKNALTAMRVRPARMPTEWPSLSLPALLRLDELGVTYWDGYPAARVEVAPGHGRITPLYAIHGEKLDMQKVANTERQSIIQGHTHRTSEATVTYEVAGQALDVTAISAGCLCRVDGYVPSVKGAQRNTGRPRKRMENWQQAVVLVHVHTSGAWHHEIVRIRDGVAHWHGKTFTSTQPAVAA